jgi:hypothetical protein
MGLDFTKKQQSCFSPAARAYLEWSWNYGLAQELQDETTRGLAKAIECGLTRGEDADDEALIVDFLELRVDDIKELTLLDPTVWDPDKGKELTMVHLREEIRKFPTFLDVWDRIEEGRR